MFQVEIYIPHEGRLTDEMQMMRTWLDHQHSEVATFRYIFERAGIMFRVDFTSELDAAAFAAAFGGKMANGQERRMTT